MVVLYEENNYYNKYKTAWWLSSTRSSLYYVADVTCACSPLSGCARVCPRMPVSRWRPRVGGETSYRCQSQWHRHTRRESQASRKTGMRYLYTRDPGKERDGGELEWICG